jgi:hypothetical protein
MVSLPTSPCGFAVDLNEQSLRLIDIKARSIVEAPKDAKYAALSYVWGGAKANCY